MFVFRVFNCSNIWHLPVFCCEGTVKFLHSIYKICNALIMHEGISMLNDSVTVHYLLSHFK